MFLSLPMDLEKNLVSAGGVGIPAVSILKLLQPVVQGNFEVLLVILLY